MKFRINITQEIIDSAKCLNPSSCAFALAYSELVEVMVGSQVYFTRDGRGLNNCVRTPLTRKQSDFVRRFDLGEKVKPTSFEVEIPEEVINRAYGDAVRAAQHIANSQILVAI